MTSTKGTRIALILAAQAVRAGGIYAFVVKPVQKASQSEAWRGCPRPRRAPAPESDGGCEKLGPPKPGEWPTAIAAWGLSTANGGARTQRTG
jgi:hypothetical protein